MRVMTDKTMMPVRVGDRVATLSDWEWRSPEHTPCSSFTSKGWLVTEVMWDGLLRLAQRNRWDRFVNPAHVVMYQPSRGRGQR